MEPRESLQAKLISVFERSEGQQRRGTWMLFGSAGLACVSVLGLLFAIFNRVDQLTLHSLSTVPMIMAFGLLTAGWTLSRGPRRVTIDDDGLQIDQSGRIRQHWWSEVGWATVVATGMSQQKCLVVYDKSGRKVASLSEAFRNFDDLVAIVKSKVADQPGAVAGDIQSRKARKSAIFTASFASAMIVASASLAWTTYEKQRAANLLETDAVEGVATIDRLSVAPNGITTRVEYTVANEAGEAGSRNAEIEPAYHAALTEADAKTIPVLFVPREPAVSRLHRGEIMDDDFIKSPIGGYGLSALTTLVSLFFLGAAALQWIGWDIDLDSKTGKISIKRLGEGE